MPIWIRAALFIAIAPGTLAGWLPWYVAGRPPLDASSPARLTGLALLLAGWTVLLWCARDFARRGRGTPAPYDPPRALVTAGLYERVRNPMYLGVVLAILGHAWWLASTAVLWYAAIVAVAFHLRVVLVEEPRLARSFGAAFEAYRARVPRWIPRLHRDSAA